MLDYPSLLLLRWATAAGPLPARGGIADALTGDLLGHAGRTRQGSWFWWGSVAVEVRETDDEPLLLTVRRGWGPGWWWQVDDADGNRIGRVRGPHLFGRREQPLAALARSPTGDHYHGKDGTLLAFSESTPEGVRLTFEPDAQADPFLQMVLLAAVLVHNRAALG